MKNSSLLERLESKIRSQIKKHIGISAKVNIVCYPALVETHGFTTRREASIISISYKKGNVDVLFKLDHIRDLELDYTRDLENVVTEIVGLALILITPREKYVAALGKIMDEINKILIRQRKRR